MRDWVILKSKEGCKAQLAHTDYILNDQLLECPDEAFPFSAIVALMDGTKINVLPKSIKKDDVVSDSENDSKTNSRTEIRRYLYFLWISYSCWLLL